MRLKRENKMFWASHHLLIILNQNALEIGTNKHDEKSDKTICL